MLPASFSQQRQLQVVKALLSPPGDTASSANVNARKVVDVGLVNEHGENAEQVWHTQPGALAVVFRTVRARFVMQPPGRWSLLSVVRAGGTMVEQPGFSRVC